MDERSFKIRLLRESDLNRVVELHFERFPDEHSTALGRGYVRREYEWFLKNIPDFSFGLEQNGRLEGVVVGSWGNHRAGVFRFAFGQILWGIASHPGFLVRRGTFRVCGRLLRRLFWRKDHRSRGSSEGKQGQRGVTYANIAVSASYRGMGGTFLMLALEKAAKAAGADYIIGTVRRNNPGPERLAKGLGWSVVSENDEFVTLRKDLK